MTAPIPTAAQRAATAAMEQARPLVARLDASRHPEEVAADLIDAWSSVETALRAMIGGSPLSGQALIRDLRARQVINFDQANGLAEFHAARERAQRTDYEPTPADVEAARTGFFKLRSAIEDQQRGMEMMPPGLTPPINPALREQFEPAPPPPAPATPAMRARRAGLAPWVWTVIAVVVIAVLAYGGWYIFGRNPTNAKLRDAIALYQQGQRERAQAGFEQVVRADPKNATAHVFLSRMARDVGNLTLARDEAKAAVEADPNSGVAQREMGSVLFTLGQYDLASKFYVRAIQADTSDHVSMGFLGCALARLGRYDEARRFLVRAGSNGPWVSCLQALPPAGTPNAVMPPPGMPTGIQPGGVVAPGASPQNPQGYQPPPSGQYIPRRP